MGTDHIFFLLAVPRRCLRYDSLNRTDAADQRMPLRRFRYAAEKRTQDSHTTGTNQQDGRRPVPTLLTLRLNLHRRIGFISAPDV